MKIIKGEERILERNTFRNPDGSVEEYKKYIKFPDKKVLERKDRFIVTKQRLPITETNHLFLVTTVGVGLHNIISVEQGNIYYGEPFNSLEGLSEAIIKDFSDFNVIQPCMELPIADMF